MPCTDGTNSPGGYVLMKFNLLSCLKKAAALAATLIVILMCVPGISAGLEVHAADESACWPVGGNGGRWDGGKDWPCYSSGKYHAGTDIGADSGTPIYASYSGVIETKKSLTTSYGNHIIIRCTVRGATVHIYYCHMSAFADVSVGDYVSAGQIIGYVGSTGNSTGPHLHYEVRDANKRYGSASSPNLNPCDYLPSKPGSSAPAVTHTVDTSYPTNFSAVALARMNVFNADHSVLSNHWVDAGDICTIHEVYTDGCCKVTYPTSSGSKTYYCKASNFTLAPTNHLVDLNGRLDGTWQNSINGLGTADVYINGTRVASDVSDFCNSYPEGTTYVINDIRAASGYRYTGQSSYSGTVGKSDISVDLPFERIATYTVSYNANGGGSAPAAQTK